MDIQRALLVVVIALLSFMLLTRWVEFSNAPVASAASQATAQPAPGMAPTDVPASAAPAAGELPSLTAPATPQAPAAVAKTTEPTTGLIRVRTDVLDVQIDPRGGDIVGVRLLKHLDKKREHPFVLLDRSEASTYIAQSGLIGPQGTDTETGRPLFHSAQREYAIKEGENSLVVELSTEAHGAKIAKRFVFQRGNYLIDLQYNIQNQGSAPFTAALYGQIKRDNGKDPSAETSGFGMVSYLGAATTSVEKPYVKLPFDEFAEKPYQSQLTGGWMAMVQHYFVSAWVAPQDQQNTLLARSVQGFHLMGFTGQTATIAPGQAGTLQASFYTGPKDQFTLGKIAPGLDLTVDYGWLWWIAQPLFVILYFFATGTLHIGDSVYQLGSGVGNWGVAIILLTLMIKLAFYRLSATSYRSMAGMRKAQPKLMEIRERYADDRQKQSMAMMELYKKEKINPMGGCLPILVQMPVFIALYWMLMETIELRHAPFFLWIQDLSVMDPYFVLPALMGITMFAQQKLNPQPLDPMQAKVMLWMPWIFTIFFVFFPAGLVLYWVVNSVLSIAQQWMITRQIEAGEARQA